jgi:hypothetical protein
MIWLLTVSIPVCAVFGAVIGLLCRGRIPLQAVCSFLVSALYFAFLAAKFAAPNEWSWTYPIVGVMYELGPFMLLFFAPAFLVSVATGKWRARRFVPSSRRCRFRSHQTRLVSF